MRVNLNDIERDCWQELQNAAHHADAGFHFLTLGSVDERGLPQIRTVVLRGVDPLERVLEFHTDIRSPKWRELSNNPHATVLGYCPQTRLQLRLQGSIALYHASSETAQTAWDKLSSRTQQTYAVAAPGSDVINDVKATNDGQANFGVLLFKAHLLDWCQLAREGNQRAMLRYRTDGKLASAKWVNA
ncbi:pyridoxamine 5'-phosphate oxidase family protein [Pantoea sp.]|uniref:pyridoxamine 5'-phosphate oxidase family protein n=1 Tax=Pantoea sp. TaxID=69393 RepID=UPI0031DCE408